VLNLIAGYGVKKTFLARIKFVTIWKLKST